jgi:hypothetical protein
MELQLKQLLMSTVEMRTEVTDWLEELDENFLAAVHAMVGTYVNKQKEDPIIGYTLEGEPKYASQMKAIYTEEIRAAKEDGQFMTIEELEIESESW